MVDRNSREESEIYRQISKTIPNIRTLNNYRGESTDEIQRRIGYLRCPYCQMPMTPLRDWGGADVWRCWSISCPNNPDERLKVDCRSVDTKLPCNTDAFWAQWRPKRLA
jgi:hypothetical protein